MTAQQCRTMASQSFMIQYHHQRIYEIWKSAARRPPQPNRLVAGVSTFDPPSTITTPIISCYSAGSQPDFSIAPSSVPTVPSSRCRLVRLQPEVPKRRVTDQQQETPCFSVLVRPTTTPRRDPTAGPSLSLRSSASASALFASPVSTVASMLPSEQR